MLIGGLVTEIVSTSAVAVKINSKIMIEDHELIVMSLLGIFVNFALLA